jgi:hypothetical protein
MSSNNDTNLEDVSDVKETNIISSNEAIDTNVSASQNNPSISNSTAANKMTSTMKKEQLEYEFRLKPKLKVTYMNKRHLADRLNVNKQENGTCFSCFRSLFCFCLSKKNRDEIGQVRRVKAPDNSVKLKKTKGKRKDLKIKNEKVGDPEAEDDNHDEGEDDDNDDEDDDDDDGDEDDDDDEDDDNEDYESNYDDELGTAGKKMYRKKYKLPFKLNNSSEMKKPTLNSPTQRDKASKHANLNSTSLTSSISRAVLSFFTRSLCCGCCNSCAPHRLKITSELDISEQLNEIDGQSSMHKQYSDAMEKSWSVQHQNNANTSRAVAWLLTCLGCICCCCSGSNIESKYKKKNNSNKLSLFRRDQAKNRKNGDNFDDEDDVANADYNLNNDNAGSIKKHHQQHGKIKKSKLKKGGYEYDDNDLIEPPPVTCIRVLRPSNDLTPVRFDSHYNIIQAISIGSISGQGTISETSPTAAEIVASMGTVHQVYNEDDEDLAEVDEN